MHNVQEWDALLESNKSKVIVVDAYATLGAAFDERKPDDMKSVSEFLQCLEARAQELTVEHPAEARVVADGNRCVWSLCQWSRPRARAP